MGSSLLCWNRAKQIQKLMAECDVDGVAFCYAVTCGGRLRYYCARCQSDCGGWFGRSGGGG